ncbi:hypothetical protein EZV62_006087 [Acer yangbiense]|uniref:Polymerase nucleotidyl transferase domain-containing protein n=1 Tax=Acer yangbiense TaxID=1000413 RepID=A0A5C7IS24_9ROSI|nr:hypothetical protein EZV62_006087 [Acer yangbiense]
MDGHEGQAQPSGFYFNGLLPNEADSSTRVLDRERWSRAEKRVAELITCIQPNKHSEIQRNAIESYMRRLITKCFPCQVLAYGSVPLQTYLPDGEIDLTAISKNQDLKWYDILKEVLENEIERENVELCVKDVEIIPAKVLIVKCIVENIAVDISFNQLVGLCALCFLEKRRILGAQHSLISTYALETLVLYIFHAFDNSFAGPLEGLVPRSSIPYMAAVDPPRRDGGELLLSKSVYAYIAAYTVLPLGQRNPDFKLTVSILLIICFGTTTLGLVSMKITFLKFLVLFLMGLDNWPNYLNAQKRTQLLRSYSFSNNVSNTSFEVIENPTGSDSNAVVKYASHAPHGVPSQHGKQSLTQISRTGNVSPVSRTESQEVFANTTSPMSSDQNNGLQNISSYENSQTDMGRSSRSDSLRNEEHDRNLAVWTISKSGLWTYGYSGIALPPVVTPYQHGPNPIYGYPADPNLVYGYPAEHFSGVDEASHVDEDPSSVLDHRVHDSEFPSPD